MLLEQLERLDETKLRQLCDERCPESGTLDFKRVLPGTSDKDKHEFLKDVCAFANAEGGDLVYGIDEDGGVAKAIIPIASETADSVMRRLGQVLDAGLEPRIQGISFHEVNVTNGYVLVVRIPSSFDGPHRYLFNSHSKFVMRNGTHTSELSFDQLRSAFDRTATLADNYGHAFGDIVLGSVASVLEVSAREGDVVARWGGEEFILFLPETNLKSAMALAERLRASISEMRIDYGQTPLSITASFGVVQSDESCQTVDELTSRADKCLYQAKSEGRNRVCDRFAATANEA